jgi:site-specific recombinase XerD
LPTGIWPKDRSPAAAADHFLEVYCRARGLSEQTIRDSYGSPIRRTFLPWCQANGIERVEDLVPEVIERFAAELGQRQTAKGSPLRPPTIRAYLKAVQQLLRWASSQKGVSAVRASEMPLPRLRRQHREVLSREEIDRLEDFARIERDKLIVRVMGDTGAREGEVANIRIGDVLVRDGRYYYLRLRGKTGERFAPIRPALYRRLRAYAEGKTGRPRTTHDRLFMAERRRNSGDYEPLTPDGIYQAVKDAADRAKLGRRIYPHLLKHSAITHMVASGMNLVTIAEIVGTSVAVIAQHYAHQSDEQRWAAMMKVYSDE